MTTVLQRGLPSKDLTVSFLGSVEHHIKALTLLDTGQNPLPVRICQQQQPDISSVQYLSFTNGVIDVSELTIATPRDRHSTFEPQTALDEFSQAWDAKYPTIAKTW